MAQIFCLDGDLSGNMRRIENGIIRAKEMDADIVTFPETSLFGWVNPDAHSRATPIPGKNSNALTALAKKYEIYICIGLTEKDGDNLHDSVILIDDEGNILHKHRKINILSELMTPPYTPGQSVTTVETRFGKIGMIICADSFEDEILQKMKAEKPDLMLIPYGWAAPEEDWPEHGQEMVKVIQNASKVIGCPVIGTNLVGEISQGPWKGLTYGGLSAAYNNETEELIVGRDRDLDVILVEVPIK